MVVRDRARSLGILRVVDRSLASRPRSGVILSYGVAASGGNRFPRASGVPLPYEKKRRLAKPLGCSLRPLLLE